MRTITPLLACLCSLASAQQPAAAAPRVQPTAIDVGQLRTGAVAEASCAVFWGDPKKSTEQATVDVPRGIRLLDAHTQEYANDACTEVRFAFDTAVAGELRAEIVVRCAGATARLPVQAVVQPASPGSSRVLVVEAPFEAFSTEDATRFDAWRGLVAAARLDVDYRLLHGKGPVVDVAALQRVDVVLVAQAGLAQLQPDDVQRLHGFVCGGGRVVVAANAFFEGTVAAANAIVRPFGLEMIEVEPNLAEQFETGEDDVRRHALCAGVAAVTAHRPSPTRIADAQRARVLVTLPGFGEHAFVALGEAQSGGEVVAIGCSLYWDWIARAPGNARLLRNLLTRPPRLK